MKMLGSKFTIPEIRTTLEFIVLKNKN